MLYFLEKPVDGPEIQWVVRLLSCMWPTRIRYPLPQRGPWAPPVVYLTTEPGVNPKLSPMENSFPQRKTALWNVGFLCALQPGRCLGCRLGKWNTHSLNQLVHLDWFWTASVRAKIEVFRNQVIRMKETCFILLYYYFAVFCILLYLYYFAVLCKAAVMKGFTFLDLLSRSVTLCGNPL